jgi:hypothetical protein
MRVASAVIGTPLDKAYPIENASLQETIYREHLLMRYNDSADERGDGCFEGTALPGRDIIDQYNHGWKLRRNVQIVPPKAMHTHIG